MLQFSVKCKPVKITRKKFAIGVKKIAVDFPVFLTSDFVQEVENIVLLWGHIPPVPSYFSPVINCW